MKRILLALFFGCIFGAVVFGQQPGKVELQPLINFDGFFDGITGWVTDILKKYWAVILSYFLVWFAFMSALSFLQGRMERWKSERRMRHSMIFRENLRAEQKDLRRELRRQELEQSRVAAKSEVEYRSRELRDLLFRERERLGDNEKIVQIDGAYYVRSETSEGDVIGHKTLDRWRAERDEEDSKPLDFDNYDYGRTYDSIVESDYQGHANDEYREYRTDYKDEPEELGLYDPLPYDDDSEEEEKWRETEFEPVEERKSISEWLKSDGFSSLRDMYFHKLSQRGRQEEDDLGLDSEGDFERDYGHRRGEFHGGY